MLRAVNYGFFAAVLVIVLGFALAFHQTQRATVSAEEIYRDFKAVKEAEAASQGTIAAIERLAELEDGNAFRAAVLALVAQTKNPDAPRGIERAIELLQQGETAAAEGVFAQILDQRQQDRATASEEAAEAARHLGAMAYLDNTAKAIEAYRTATELDPDDVRRGSCSGASTSAPAAWPRPSRHFRGRVKRPSASATSAT